MSALHAMLAPLDDDALAGFASAGLLRRAHAGLAKPDAAETLDSDNATARLRIEAQEVLLGADGPAKARCDCPSTGMCRHVLMAVLHLRATLADPTPTDAPDARADIAALSMDDIRAFAGTDWPQAVRIAQLSRNVVPEGESSSCVMRLKDAPGPVTFLAGAGLRGAVFKGPDGRRKRFVAAAALVLGAHKPDLEQITVNEIDPDLLVQARTTVLRALSHGLKGDPLLAQDALFDLAISARAETAPRLAALLRAAARHAGLLAARDPDADPGGYLVLLSECHALIRALQKAPADLHLAGQLRRDYDSAPPLDMTILGVALWRTESGARGLTIHGWDGQRFLSTGPARAAGADPQFSPTSAYHQPWWRGQTPKRMSGTMLHLPAPRLSQDGVLPGQLDVSPDARPLQIDTLPRHDSWSALHADIATRKGIGLRSTGRSVPALIRLVAVTATRFDEITQTDLLELGDAHGQTLTIQVPSETCAQRIHEMQHKGLSALIEAEPKGDALQFRLISILIEATGEVWNVTLDPVPDTLKASGALHRLRLKARRFLGKPAPIPPVSALSRFAEMSLQALCDGMQSPVQNDALPLLADQADMLGLGSIGPALNSFDPVDPDAALRLGWQILLIRRAAAQRLAR